MQIRPLVLAVASLAPLAVPAAVAADCDLAGPIDEEVARAPVAFVGRAIDVDGSVATFHVVEVWKGNVPERVQVFGVVDGAVPGEGPDAGHLVPVVTEDDRPWVLAADYLVLPFVDDNGILRDSICTATTRWRARLADLRPDGEAAGKPADMTHGAPPLGVIGAVVVVGGIATLTGLAFRRR